MRPRYWSIILGSASVKPALIVHALACLIACVAPVSLVALSGSAQACQPQAPTAGSISGAGFNGNLFDEELGNRTQRVLVGSSQNRE